MSITVNPEFRRKILELLPEEAKLCFNCGNCTAICPLEIDGFPRRIIRLVQLGFESEVLANPKELWLCLQCGLCDETCPRQASPCKFIHGVRRYALKKMGGV